MYFILYLVKCITNLSNSIYLRHINQRKTNVCQKEFKTTFFEENFNTKTYSNKTK